MESTPTIALAAEIGIDWGDARHDIALHVPGSAAIETERLIHEPAAIASWLTRLEERFGGRPVGIAMETSRGPLVHALLEAPFVVLYPVNPRSLKRFRETFSPSGAKDDEPDARLLLELLVKHRDQLHAWRPDDVATRTLARLVEQRRTAVALRTELVQQLQAVLKDYFPQALEWAGTELSSAMACQFLLRWPTLAAVQRARPATIRQWYTAHQGRRRELIEARVTAIATATPLTRDPAIIDSSALYATLLARQLLTLGPGIARFDTEIAARFAAHPDAVLFDTLPGAGAALAPRLLAAFGTDRTRFPSALAMQTHTGIAPITVRSGKSHQVHWRWAASTFLRQTFHEFAQFSIRFSPWARAFYHQQRQRGKKHHAAVRALAFKWIRILWRCWHDHTQYDDARYTHALQLRGSPLATLLHPGAPAVPA